MFYLVADDRSLSLSIYWFDSNELFRYFSIIRRMIMRNRKLALLS